MSDMDALIEAAGRAGCVLLDLEWDDLDPTDLAEAESYHRTVLEAVGLPALLERVEAADATFARARIAEIDRDALAAKVARVEAVVTQFEADDKESLTMCGQHLYGAVLSCAEHVRAALDDK